jgi:hypothetical protein
MFMLVDFIVADVVNVDNVVNSICRLKHILQWPIQNALCQFWSTLL